MTDAMRKVGRPAQDNKVALREILSNPDKCEVFVECVERLVRSKEALQIKSELHGDDVKSTAEAYSLGKGFLSSIVNEIVKGELTESLELLSDKADILELFVGEA